MSFADELKNMKTKEELDYEEYINAFYDYIKSSCMTEARDGYKSTIINSKVFYDVAEYYYVNEDNLYLKEEYDDEATAQKIVDEIKSLLEADELIVMNIDILKGSCYGHEEKIAVKRSESDSRAISTMNFLFGGDTNPDMYYKTKWVRDGIRYYFKIQIGW